LFAFSSTQSEFYEQRYSTIIVSLSLSSNGRKEYLYISNITFFYRFHEIVTEELNRIFNSVTTDLKQLKLKIRGVTLPPLPVIRNNKGFSMIEIIKTEQVVIITY
jgi:hypothetical protein